MDRITKSILTEFATEYKYTDCPEDEQFEHLVNYIVISKEYSESFNPSEIFVAGGDDTAIDGVAIIVNGALVTEEDEIDDLLQINHYLDVEYIFIQSKTSPSFNGAAIGSFVEGVRDFFRENPRLRRNESIKAKASLSDYIFNYTSKMRSNPTCSLYYATTGQWSKNDQNLIARLDQGKEDIDSTQMFSKVNFNPIGATEVQKLYRQSRESISVEIDFANKVTLPKIDGVEQAYIGVLPATEYLRLIVDESDNIRKSVFEENIRDFQGDTTVNAGIQDTLTSGNPITFVILNNGITIVCKELHPTGNKFAISGYQIVNGCQTSHVLYECRSQTELQSLLIPIRLVNTSDESIIGRVIKATNSQNSVKPEELEAMTEFQKRLEEYYRTYNGENKLYYERRSKQWVTTKVEKTRVVTIPIQIKAFASMFLDLPHRVAGYYGTVRRNIGEKIFKLEHNYSLYYASGLTHYRLDSLLRSKDIEPEYRQLKWFLLMMIRCEIGGRKIPKLSSREADAYSNNIIATLEDDHSSAEAFYRVIQKVRKLKIGEINKDILKAQSLRDTLLSIYEL